MGSDRYCLRWNNHQNNLLGVFSQLLQEESLVDVTLACSEGHSIRAHKVVLSACSSYFQSLFLDHPNWHPIIILKDVCFAELKTLVEFMYRGEVNLEYCQLPTFLKTAESLQVKGLTEITHLRSTLSPNHLHHHLHQPPHSPPPPHSHSHPHHHHLQHHLLQHHHNHQHHNSQQQQHADVAMLPSRDGQPPSRDDSPATVIATAALTTTIHHEPLPLIRRHSSRSPNEIDMDTTTTATTTTMLTTMTTAASTTIASSTTERTSPSELSSQTSQPRSPPASIVPSTSPTRPVTGGGSNTVETISRQPSCSPVSRVMSVSPSHPADTSSICEDEELDDDDDNDDDDNVDNNDHEDVDEDDDRHSNMSTDIEDAVLTKDSETKYPSSRRLAWSECFKVIPGSSNLLPEQQAPLSLKKVSDSADWEKDEAAIKSGGNNGSDYAFGSKFSQDSERERDFQVAYKCAYCGVAFPHQSKLTRHILLSHSLEKLKYRDASSTQLQQQQQPQQPPPLLPYSQRRHSPITAPSMSASTSVISHEVGGGGGNAAGSAGDRDYGGRGHGSGSGSGPHSDWSMRMPLMELAPSQHDSQQPHQSFEPAATAAAAAAAAAAAVVAAADAQAAGAVCKFCGKAFPDVSALIGHLPAHTGDRPFKCEFCGKAFKLRHHMKDHCRVHTGERPFRCALCGKTFSRSTILKAHEKTHYPKYVRKFLSSPSPDDEHRPPDIPLPCDLSTSENSVVEASTSAGASSSLFAHRTTTTSSPSP